MIGLINPGMFRVGDVLSSGPTFEVRNFPRFAPEIFAQVAPREPSMSKGFGKGLAQLGEEGVVQVFWPRVGAREPILGAVGPLLWLAREQLDAELLEILGKHHRANEHGQDLAPEIQTEPVEPEPPLHSIFPVEKGTQDAGGAPLLPPTGHPRDSRACKARRIVPETAQPPAACSIGGR